jgi:hypothetical protein
MERFNKYSVGVGAERMAAKKYLRRRVFVRAPKVGGLSRQVGARKIRCRVIVGRLTLPTVGSQS